MGAANSALASDVATDLDSSVYPQPFETRLMALSRDMFKRALFLTGNRDAANDLVQDSIVKALHGRRSFRRDSNLRGWAMAIMYNLFVDTRRRRSYRLEYGAMVAAPVVDDPLGPMDLLSLADVEAALGALTEENRRLFRMAYVENRSYREISAATGLCVRTLATRLFRARTRLRTELTRTYESRVESRAAVGWRREGSDI